MVCEDMANSKKKGKGVKHKKIFYYVDSLSKNRTRK
jgi:hypothetical protein